MNEIFIRYHERILYSLLFAPSVRCLRGIDTCSRSFQVIVLLSVLRVRITMSTLLKNYIAWRVARLWVIVFSDLYPVHGSKRLKNVFLHLGFFCEMLQ